MSFFKQITKLREFMILSIVIVLFVIMSFASPYFLNSGNLLALFLGLSIEAIIAVGMTNLMVSGGFDMSVGSVVAFTGASTAMMIKMGVPVPLAVLIGLGLGALIGLFNGFIVGKMGINPFVTTLASLSLFRGLTLMITGEQNIAGLADSFKTIGQTTLWGVHAPIWYAIILVIVGDILLRKARFFRQNYYIGGNEKAARLSGINRHSYEKLRQYLGLPQRKVDIYDVMQQLARVDEDVIEALNIDVRCVDPSPPTSKGLAKDVELDGDYYKMVDEWGIGWKMPAVNGHYYNKIDRPLEAIDSIEFLNDYAWPDPVDPVRSATIKERADKFVYQEKKAYILGRQYAGIWETALWMSGFEKFFCDMLLNEKYAHTLMEKVTDLKMKYWEQALKAVGDNVLVISEADDLATQSSLLCSVDLYKKMVSGGGVDTQKILPFGTPDEVREEVKRRIGDLAYGGGFVFAAVHNVQSDVPPENFMAMWETLQEFGVYKK